MFKESDEPWDKSITKLLAFGETEFDRVIHIDTDATVLNNMDELFFLPSAKVAMPRAYWALPDTTELSALVVVIEPSYREYTALMDNAGAAIYGQVGVNETTRYDVTLLNDRYADSALVLPHRQYGLVTSEFRRDDHRNFLGNEYEDWDPERVLAEAKVVHFADAPLPKPWIMWPQKLLVETLPKCKVSPGTAQESGCQDRQVWRDLYNSFRRRRRVCFFLPSLFTFSPHRHATLLILINTGYLPPPKLPSPGMASQRQQSRRGEAAHPRRRGAVLARS